MRFNFNIRWLNKKNWNANERKKIKKKTKKTIQHTAMSKICISNPTTICSISLSFAYTHTKFMLYAKIQFASVFYRNDQFHTFKANLFFNFSLKRMFENILRFWPRLKVTNFRFFMYFSEKNTLHVCMCMKFTSTTTNNQHT